MNYGTILVINKSQFSQKSIPQAAEREAPIPKSSVGLPFLGVSEWGP